MKSGFAQLTSSSLADRQPRYLLVITTVRPEALRPRLTTGLPLVRLQLYVKNSYNGNQ